jgi:ribosomal protein L32
MDFSGVMELESKWSYVPVEASAPQKSADWLLYRQPTLKVSNARIILFPESISVKHLVSVSAELLSREHCLRLKYVVQNSPSSEIIVRRKTRAPIVGAGAKQMQEKEKVIQVNTACSKCGSYYRRGKICNVCGTENEYSAPAETNPFKHLVSQRRNMHAKKKYRY